MTGSLKCQITFVRKKEVVTSKQLVWVVTQRGHLRDEGAFALRKQGEIHCLVSISQLDNQRRCALACEVPWRWHFWHNGPSDTMRMDLLCW
jgi:hypothetical protein